MKHPLQHIKILVCYSALMANSATLAFDCNEAIRVSKQLSQLKESDYNIRNPQYVEALNYYQKYFLELHEINSEKKVKEYVQAVSACSKQTMGISLAEMSSCVSASKDLISKQMDKRNSKPAYGEHNNKIIAATFATAFAPIIPLFWVHVTTATGDGSPSISSVFATMAYVPIQWGWFITLGSAATTPPGLIAIAGTGGYFVGGIGGAIGADVDQVLFKGAIQTNVQDSLAYTFYGQSKLNKKAREISAKNYAVTQIHNFKNAKFSDQGKTLKLTCPKQKLEEESTVANTHIE